MKSGKKPYFAPFFAAGMLLAYFCGSVFAWLIPLAAAGFAVAFAKKRALTACFVVAEKRNLRVHKNKWK